jgi:hypothetical protein
MRQLSRRDSITDSLSLHQNFRESAGASTFRRIAFWKTANELRTALRGNGKSPAWVTLGHRRRAGSPRRWTIRAGRDDLYGAIPAAMAGHYRAAG